MFRSKLSDVFEEVHNFSIIQRFTGISTLTYTRGKFGVSKKLFVISSIIISAIVGSNIFLANSARKRTFNVCQWYSNMSITEVLSAINSVVVFWIQNSLKVGSLNNCLLKIQTVDLVMFSMGERIPRSGTSNGMLTVFALVTAAIALRMLLLSNLKDSVILVIILLSILVILAQFFIDRIATIILQRFKIARKCLSKCTKMESSNLAALSEKLVFCYHHLSSSCESFNKFCSLQIFSILTHKFIQLFSEAYAIFCTLLSDEPVFHNKWHLTIKVIWSLIAFLQIWQVSHQFSAISNEAKEFNFLLYQVMVNDKTDKVINNQKLMLHVATNHEVVFTACGFFNLDYTLVHSMIASATTYLVILIQIGQQSPTELEAAISSVQINTTTTAIP